MYKTIQEILDAYKVKSYKNVGDLIAIRKGDFLVFFLRYNKREGYRETGLTLKIER